MKRFVFIPVIALVLSTPGCYYDKGELIYPPTSVIPVGCDTTAVKYSIEVVNILGTNCYSCHGGSAISGGGNVLDTYSGVRNMAISGRLVRAVTHTGPPNTRMPRGGNKLQECDIAKIRTWVRNGALNN